MMLFMVADRMSDGAFRTGMDASLASTQICSQPSTKKLRR